MRELVNSRRPPPVELNEFEIFLRDSNGVYKNECIWEWCYGKFNPDKSSSDTLIIGDNGSLSAGKSNRIILSSLNKVELYYYDNEHGKTIMIKADDIVVSMRTEVDNVIQFKKFLAVLMYWTSFKKIGLENKFIIQDVFGEVPSTSKEKIRELIQSTLTVNEKSAKVSIESDGVMKIKFKGEKTHLVNLTNYLESEVNVIKFNHLGNNGNLINIQCCPEIRETLGMNNSSYDGTYTFAFDNEMTMNYWFIHFNLFTRKELLSLSFIHTSNRMKLHNFYEILIIDADLKNIHDTSAMNDGFYVELSSHGIRLFTTSLVKQTLSPFWRQDFAFKTNFLVENLQISIKVPNMDPALEDKSISTLQVDANLFDEKVIGSCIQKLTLYDNEGNEVGNVCLSVKKDRYFLLQPCNFNRFENLLNEISANKFVDWFYDMDEKSSIINSIGLEKISDILLNCFQMIGKEQEYLQSLMDEELLELKQKLESNSSFSHIANTLFRGNTLLTKSLERYFNQIGKTYLLNTLGPYINELLNDKNSVELDPARIRLEDADEKQTAISRNTVYLLEQCNKLWNAIDTSSNDIPISMKTLLKALRLKIEKLFPGIPSDLATVDELVKNSISSLLFLRFFCPVILNPNLFDIINYVPNEASRRKLTTIAKILMNVSSASQFGEKDGFMKPINSFIESREKILTNYVDRLTEKSLDFTPRKWNIQENEEKSFDQIKNVYLHSQLLELPSYPRMIEKHLAYTMLIIILNATKEARDDGKPMIKHANMDSLYLDVIEKHKISNNPFASEKTKRLTIGELEFEKITENNAELFGNELISFLQNTEEDNLETNSKKLTLEDTTVSSITRLEQEASLLWNKIKRLLIILNDTECPEFSHVVNSDYIDLLKDSIYTKKLASDDGARLWVDFSRKNHNPLDFKELFELTSPNSNKNEFSRHILTEQYSESSQSSDEESGYHGKTVSPTHMSGGRSSKLSKLLLGSPSEHDNDNHSGMLSRWFRKDKAK